jgi:hypothetical protein
MYVGIKNWIFGHLQLSMSGVVLGKMVCSRSRHGSTTTDRNWICSAGWLTLRRRSIMLSGVYPI